MTIDEVAGHLEVGHNDKGEVVVNYPQIGTNKIGRIVFSPGQARTLANALIKHADLCEGKPQ